MNARDIEDKVLDGSIAIPHAPMAELIVMVTTELAAGAPDASWAIDGVAEGQELPCNVERELRAHFGC